MDDLQPTAVVFAASMLLIFGACSTDATPRYQADGGLEGGVNDAPSISAASIGVGPYDETSILVAIPQGWSDPEGDAPGYTYQWSVNNSTVTGATTVNLSGADFDKGDSVYVEVTPFDGIDSGVPMNSNTVTIQNAAPGAAEIALLPEAPTDGIMLYVEIVTASTDPDPADTVTYSFEWLRNGLNQGFPNTQTEVLPELVIAGDTWVVVVAPSDGFVTGLTSSAMTVILAGPDSWVPTSTINAPPGRRGHTAVWTGTEMIVWGGANASSSNVNTGGRYDPGTDTWTATNTTGAPSARRGHTAVWTGAEMIVWGGGDGGRVNSGGRYNPATNVWTATSTVGAPSARILHTAVWTGEEMIIWSGYDGLPSNTGGRYNITDNTWTATTTTGAPSPRYLHTAVWTGTEMIIWAGSGSDVGSRYDPATDTWSVASVTAESERRSLHTAIWTGTEMIVWGGIAGLGGATEANTGGRYDPVSDAWMATTTVNAPAARYAHSAIWTGTKMIVWGGRDPAHADTGGQYDAMTDTWEATSIVGAPPARTQHTAVWAGTEMIVWGGKVGAENTETGGRYRP